RTGQAPSASPASITSRNTFTASCASSPAARTRICRVPPNSDVERASSPSRTGSERRSAPESSTRSPGSRSMAASLSAAAAAPASSGPQKRAIRPCWATRGATAAKSRWVAFTPRASRLRAERQREPGDDPVGDFHREILQRGLFGGNGGEFGGNDIDASVRAGGRIDHDTAADKIDELVASAERAPLAADRLIGQQAQALEFVVEQHVEAVARLGRVAALRQPVAQRITHQPSGLAFDRSDFDCREPLRDRSAATPGEIGRAPCRERE